jgi:SAM-dependent methyltransferase
MRELLPPTGPAAPILEIGCGNGVARDQIEAAFGCQVHGCDINIEALRRGSPGRGQRYLYNVHDRRPAWRGHFGTILLLDALEHIPDAPGCWSSVAHHLAPDGMLLITVPAGQWVFSRYDRLVGHVKRYSATLLRLELAAAGLRLLRHQYWGLTLLPVLAARKAILACAPRPAVVRTGFQPASPLVDSVLRGLMWLERRLFPRPFYGAALVGVAGKAGGIEHPAR